MTDPAGGGRNWEGEMDLGRIGKAWEAKGMGWFWLGAVQNTYIHSIKEMTGQMRTEQESF